MGGSLRRLFRRPPTIVDCMRAAMRAQCEPSKAADTRSEPGSGWQRGSGAPPHTPVVEVRILSDDEFAAWLLDHPDEAA